MAKFKFNRINWKNILIISLALVLGIGAIAGVSSIVKNEKTTLSSLEFKRGALNDLGFYIESDTSIYTKDLIECQGLEIEPDFETIGEYQVFYYDSNKQFLGKTDKINSQTDGVYVKGETYGIAKYCRIVITPEAEKDEDGLVIEDWKINFYEVAGIAAKYKISVDKEQKFNPKDLFKASEENLDKSILFDEVTNTYSFASNSGYATTDFIDVVGIESLKIYYNTGSEFGIFTYLFLTEDGTPISGFNMFGDMNTTVIDVPSGSASILITYKTGSEFSLYKLS